MAIAEVLGSLHFLYATVEGQLLWVLHVDAATVVNVLMHGLVHVSTLLCVACVMVWSSQA